MHLPMELEPGTEIEASSTSTLWPLEPIDLKRLKFPCCLVWTPLPVVSWLVPYIGHIGICREDGTVLDFFGSNLVNVGDFGYGAIARYLPLDSNKCCFPTNMATHTCMIPYKHAESGTALSWDDALNSSMRQFQVKFYNLFMCNCHSFVARCLNQLAYDGSINWNMVNLGALILWKGRWINKMSVVRSFSPFLVVVCIGIFMAGWLFLAGMAILSALLLGWFIFGIYCVKGLIC